MITLTVIDHVSAPPEWVWHFLTHLHEGDTYLRWHPKDHKAFRLLGGDGETVGSTFNAVEVLGSKRFSLKYRLDRTERLRYLEYSASGLLRPLRLATGTFTLQPSGNDQTELRANVHIGYRLPIMDWLIRKIIDTEAIKKHMHEEGYYLNKALNK